MRDYLLLLLVVGLVPFILARAWIGALAWNWIGLMNPHLYTWTLADFPFAQLIGITFLAGWIIARDKRMFPLTAGVVGLCVLWLFVTVKHPFSWNPEVAWEKWKQFTTIIAGALMMGTLIYGKQRIRIFIWVVLFCIGVFFGARGGLFAIATGGAYNVQGPAPSFIGGNTHLGVALLMVLPMFMAFQRDVVSALWRWGAIAGLWLTILAVMFTYSRGAWLGLAAVAGLMYLNCKRKLLIAAMLVPVAITGVAMLPERFHDRLDVIVEYKEDTSALQRLQGWGVAFNVATRHPLGSGFVLDATPVDVWMEYANFHHPDFKRANAAHSIYFQMLGDHGFLGLLLFLFVLLSTMWMLLRLTLRTRDDPQRRWISHYAMALLFGLVGYAVSGAFVSLAHFDLFYTFVVLAGVLLRESRQPVQDAKATAAVPPLHAPPADARGAAPASLRPAQPTQRAAR